LQVLFKLAPLDGKPASGIVRPLSIIRRAVDLAGGGIAAFARLPLNSTIE